MTNFVRIHGCDASADGAPFQEMPGVAVALFPQTPEVEGRFRLEACWLYARVKRKQQHNS